MLFRSCFRLRGSFQLPEQCMIMPVTSVTGTPARFVNTVVVGLNLYHIYMIQLSTFMDGQFSGALYCIHIASKQNGLYHEMCDKCRDLPVSERHKGCDSHAGTHFLLSLGSPQTNLTFINASERIKN